MVEFLETRELLSVAQPTCIPYQPAGSAQPFSSSSPTGYTPAQIRHAYGFDQISFPGGIAGDGSGQTIAIVDAYDDPNIAGDLHAFDQYWGLPDPTFTKVDQNGGTNYPPPNSGWISEIALDVEWSHAIAPGAGILLVEASDNSFTNLYAGVDYARQQPGVVAVSMSWGLQGEYSGETSDDSNFTTPSGHAGVVFLASTGDNGAPTSYPAASPNVVSVGGTTLNLDSQGNYLSESGWSGSGGGLSAYEAQPAYQQGVVTQSSTWRANPDVAYDADPNTGFPVYDSYNNGTSAPWGQWGGTSDAAPQWAALVAIADQGRTLAGEPVLDSPTLLADLYQLPAADFHDITTGSSTGSPNYNAGPGYDLVTGLGTPLANQVVAGLVGNPMNNVFSISAPASSTAGSAFNLTVTAQDADGNTLTGYTGTVHFTSSDGQAVLPADYTFTSSDAGVHTFSVALETAGSQTVTVTDTANASMIGNAGVSISPAAASGLQVASFPSPTTAGTSHSFTVKVLDAYGNTATGYTGTVHFTSSDSQAVLPADYTFTTTDAGVHSFSATLKTAGTQALTATDTANASLTSSQTGIAVTPAAANHFQVTIPATTYAGTPFSITVTAVDPYSNVATGYRGTVHLTSSDSQATLPGNYTFTSTDAGKHTFSNGATLRTTGSQTVTATDTAHSTITGTASTQVNAPGPATHFTVSAPASTTAGQTFSVTVTALDANNAIATGYTGTIHFTSSDSKAVLPANYTFTSTDQGVHRFTGLVLKTSGSKTITATDTATSSITGQVTVKVNAAAAKTFTVKGFPTITTAGVANSFTVTAKDAYGNTATGYKGTVHFTSSDPQAALPADATLTNGTGTFQATLKTAGKQSLTATDTVTSTLKGSETGISVSPAAASQLAVTAPAGSSAGGALSFTVTAKDAYGNTVPGYTGTVHFTSSDSQAVLPADYTFTRTDAGVHTFSATLKTAGNQALTATDSANASLTGSTIVAVSPAAASLLVLSAPANAMAGSAFTVTLTALDPYGNTATGYTGTVHFTSSDTAAGVQLPADYTFTATDQGVHTFSGLVLDTAGSQTVTATDTVQSSVTGSGTLTISPAAVQSLVLAGFPSPTTAGAAGNFTVTALDAYGNVVTGYTGTVHFTSGDTQAALPADYTFTAGDAGRHTFTATLKTAGSQSLTATDTGNSSLTSTQTGIVVNPGAANHLAFLQQPTNTLANAVITPAVTVEVLDAYNNLLTGDNTDVVTIAIGNNPSSGTLSGTTTVTVVGGIATFSNLSINAPGSPYTLVASSGSLTGATSANFTISYKMPKMTLGTSAPVAASGVGRSSAGASSDTWVAVAAAPTAVLPRQFSTPVAQRLSEVPLPPAAIDWLFARQQQDGDGLLAPGAAKHKTTPAKYDWLAVVRGEA